MWSAVRPGIEWTLGLHAMREIYLAARSRFAAADPQIRPSFPHCVLQVLDVTWQVDAQEMAGIPRTGGVVVVCNHPFGGVDGLVLGAALSEVRPDVRLLANHLLARIPELSGSFIAVDPFGGPAARTRNLAPLRAALDWLQQGHALVAFPAGEVAHFRLREGCISDPPWSPHLARMILRAGVPVVPVHISGRNSLLFQAAGLIHPRLRTLLLPRQLGRQRGRCLRLRIGAAIPQERLKRCATPAELTDYLRLRTFILNSSQAAGSRELPASGAALPAVARSASQPQELAAEIEGLPPSARLAESGPWQVLCARAADIPRVLQDIGRLRELTFREVGEGSGRAVDLDRFDQYYLHLVLWNRRERQIGGAYRVGPVDDILRNFGLEALYTHTLFHYGLPLLEALGPALEMGRSFVVPAYQKSYAPLMMLWKGIGSFVIRQPRYRTLLGAVSISDEYDTMTKRLLLSVLKQHCCSDELATMLRPRRPPELRPLPASEERLLARVVQDIDQVDDLVRELEAGRRGVPVLLRQYLRLGARLLGFNVDDKFSNVIDGLCYVDLAAVDQRILEHYMGAEEAARYLASHRSAHQLVG
jgi:putative hemolysin